MREATPSNAPAFTNVFKMGSQSTGQCLGRQSLLLLARRYPLSFSRRLRKMQPDDALFCTGQSSDAVRPTPEPEPLAHQLYVLGEDIVLENGETFASTYVDVRGCHIKNVLVRWSPVGAPTSNTGVFNIYSSVDAIAADLKQNPLLTFSSNQGAEINGKRTRHAINDPYLYVRVEQRTETPVQQILARGRHCPGVVLPRLVPGRLVTTFAPTRR